jgi:hypothetical protein
MLADSPSEQERLAKSAREAAAGEFKSERIEEKFIAVLSSALAPTPSSQRARASS